MTDDTVTIRELHSMQQIRLTIEQMVELMKDLTAEHTTWEAAVAKYGVYEHSEDTAEWTN